MSLSIAHDMGIAKVPLKTVYVGSDNAFSVTDGSSSNEKLKPIEIFTPQWWPEEDPVTGKRLDDVSTH